MPSGDGTPSVPAPAGPSVAPAAAGGAAAAPAGQVVFDLRGTPLLASGRSDEVLAAGEHLVARVKVYASGGENASHAHVDEEHLFLVVAGVARFHFGRGGEEQVDIGANQGVLLPPGTFYRFEALGDENLVLIRVGQGHRGATRRIGADGASMAGSSAANRHQPGVPSGAAIGDP